MSFYGGNSNGGEGSIVSTGNSIYTPLNNGQTFTGTTEFNSYTDVMISCQTDQNGTLYIEFSVDGTNWNSITLNIIAGRHAIHKYMKGLRYFRVRFVNDSGSNQTYLRLHIMYGSFGSVLTSGLNAPISPSADAIITRTISEEVAIAENKYIGRFLVNKFGQNADVDASGEDIWDGGGVYTGFPTGDAETIEVVSSLDSDASDDTGARTIRVFGLDANFELQQEDLTMNGTSGVTSSNTYKRIYRAYVLTAGATGTNNGTITIRHSSTTANIFTVIAAGFGQTEITAYTIPAGYTGYIKHYSGAIIDTNSNRANIGFWVRPENSAFRIIRPFVVGTDFNFTSNIYGGLRFEEKTDLVMRCTSINNGNASITGRWDMILVSNTI